MSSKSPNTSPPPALEEPGIIFPEKEALWFAEPAKGLATGKGTVTAMRCARKRSSTRYYLLSSPSSPPKWYMQPLNDTQKAHWHSLKKVAITPQGLGNHHIQAQHVLCERW
jgi:hypothetical protein